jgi:hypothetical protein
MDYQKKTKIARLLEPESSSPAIPSAPVLTPEDPEPINVQTSAPETSVTHQQRARHLQVSMTPAIASIPALAVPVPMEAYQTIPAQPQAVHDVPRSNSYSGYDKLAYFIIGIACLAGLGAIVSVLYHYLKQANTEGISFSGIAPNNTCFTSADSLAILPNASASFEGSGFLNTLAEFKPGYSQTYCNLSFPDNVSQLLSSSSFALRNVRLESAQVLETFSQHIFLNCSGQAAKISINAQVNANGQSTPVLSSVIQFSNNCSSFFSNLMKKPVPVLIFQPE